MTPQQERNRGQLYGAFTFATVVVASYGQFLLARRITGEPWQVVVTFILGGVYAAFAILGNCWSESDKPRAKFAYFLILCAILTGLMCITPILRGYFFIIVLPTVSQAIFDLTWKGALAVGAYLFTLSVSAAGYLYGPAAIGEAALSYTAAFAFTIVFTVMTTRAVRARIVAEKLRAELEAANALLRAHAAAADELATTRERNRLAREIHDGVGHYLTTIKVQLDAAAALFPIDPPRAADSVAKAARLAGEALDDVRRSVGALATDAARPPLAETLRQLAADGSPAPAVQIEGTPRLIAVAAEHALFRTAQEGLTNVRKHAAATSSTLTLDFRDPARVRLAVADNGRGVSPTSGVNGTGYGLRGLRERIALLGGTVSAGGQPGGGFRLEVEVPA